VTFPDFEKFLATTWNVVRYVDVGRDRN